MAAVLFFALLASLCVNTGLSVPLTNSTSGGSESEATAESPDLAALQEHFYCFCSDNTTLGQRCSPTAKTCRPCPEGWTYLEGTCYYFSDDKLDWKNSKDSCVSKGSHLAVLHTQEQHDHLEKIAHDIGGLDYHFWIGLSDSEEEGVWKWVDNTLVNKTYWSETPKEPNNHESGGPQGEDCVVLQSQSKTWFDVPCNFLYKRICEMRARLCPQGWTYLDGKCYYFSKDKLDWKNSSDSCASMGSRLTILHTQEQHDHLEKIAHDNGGLDYHFWIGLSDSEEEGVWKWVDNTQLNKTYWSETPKEPNNDESGGPQGEDCVVLQASSKTWFDVPCNFIYKRICEMDAVKID